MYCKKCGKYNPDKETKCKYCGGDLSVSEIYRCNHEVNNTDRFWFGVCMALLLGIVGLIIGLYKYEDGYSRESFIKGWTRCFFITLAISLFLVIICFIELAPFLSSIYYY